jgi:HK97 family phage portal protein
LKKARKTVSRKESVSRTPAAPPAQQRDLNPVATALFYLSPRFRALASGFSQPYKDHPWVYVAISALARNIVQVPWLINTGNRKDPTVLENGPWVELFDRINPHLDIQQYFEAIVINLSLCGECFVVKESKTGAPVRPGEVPFELWPLAGNLFTPVHDKKTKNLSGWEYHVPNSSDKILYDLHQLIPIRYTDPDNPHRGLAPMDAARMTARSDWKAMAYDEAFFDNDATPGGIIKAPRLLTEKERENLKARHQEDHAGWDKGWRTKILEGGLDYIPTTLTHRDMQFKEKREWDRDEILAVFGVPKSEVGLEPPVNMVTGAGSMSTNVKFWTGTLLPIMSRIESAHWRHLFLEASQAKIWGAFDRSQVEALQPNLSAMLDVALKLRQMGYSTNEINERLNLGMPEIDGGDLHFIPVGMTAVEDLEAAEEEEALATAEQGGAPGRPDAEEDELDTGETGKLVRDNLRTLEFIHELNAIPAPTELERANAIRTVKTFFRARQTKRLKQWADVLRKSVVPFEPRFRSRLKRYLFLLRNEQIKRVAKLDLQKSLALLPAVEADGDVQIMLPEGPGREFRDTIEEVLFPTEEWNGIMKTMHHKIYMDVTNNAYEKVFKELGGSFAFDESDVPVIELVSRREDILVKANTTIRKRMARELEEGVRNGETINEIQNRIKTAFQGFSATRSLRIARTEVAATTNQARFDAMETEGVDKHQWLAAGDEAVRESHARQDGVIVAIGQRFQNGLVHPNDPDGPPEETINCRCVAVASE